MLTKSVSLVVATLVAMLISLSALAQQEANRTITLHMGEIPGLINFDGSGAFVDFARYLDAQDPSTDITISIYPIFRAINNISRGQADIALPAIRPLKEDISDLPFAFSTVSFGVVPHVLYTHKSKPLNATLLKANPDGYIIESIPHDFDFEVVRSHSIRQSLKRLHNGRIDAFIWAQTEADQVLRELGYTDIKRELFADMEDVFMIPKGEAGEEIDAYLTQLLTPLIESGELEQQHRKIHAPYDDWQP
ncbi:type 2 periplasmic-binding domain-containing protein [Salinivibrio proteolyticus]|uniref:ABC transporter substrate-binding protein n=1 Tax=Salinivibrio proteolyticus TaxID=334715 RepID=A0ABY7LAH6_9GAMM|nr:ABC transporter substrate-binding protein [Salinivibrio proteolyticus]WBA13617.1 ABC transporter substrate-binding protein [Salinivibrio proteolyticus]